MKKLVIFDLDGTLLNTLDDLAAAGNHLLRAHGWPEHPAERYKLFVGNGVYKLVERMIPADADHSPGALALLRDEYNAYYSAHNADLTAPYPGVPELLGALEQAAPPARCSPTSRTPLQWSSAGACWGSGSRSCTASGRAGPQSPTGC